MQVRSEFRHEAYLDRPNRSANTVHVEHGVARELMMIALVLALGVLAAVVILLPAAVSG